MSLYSTIYRTVSICCYYVYVHMYNRQKLYEGMHMVSVGVSPGATLGVSVGNSCEVPLG